MVRLGEQKQWDFQRLERVERLPVRVRNQGQDGREDSGDDAEQGQYNPVMVKSNSRRGLEFPSISNLLRTVEEPDRWVGSYAIGSTGIRFLLAIDLE